MHSLEDWIIKLVNEDSNELNRKYSSVNYGTVEKEIESLCDIEPMKYGKNRVDADLLGKMHLKIRTQKYEAEIWDAIIFRIAGPLPKHIAHDLIERDIIVDQLGHTRQDDEVQWRLASLVDEALLNLAWDFFTDPKYKAAELQKLLSQYPDHVWLLDKWQHWALFSEDVKELDKEIAFHRWAWEHPKPCAAWKYPRRPPDVPSPEQYLEIMADKQRQKIEAQLQVEHEEREEQLRIERDANSKRLELERIAKDMLSETEIQQIFTSQEPSALLALASNSRIEIQWIQKLINCHHVKGARQIREAAESNIKARQY